MKNFYLRVEAVNLKNNIDDTHDISTIRGGSYLMLEAVTALSKSLKMLNPVSIGASTGIFAFTTDDNPQNICKDVRRELKRATGDYGIFVVDYLEKGTNGNFAADMRLLLAKNHWSQFQQPTLVMPRKISSASACAKDGLRPAKPGTNDQDGKEISEYTEFRRQQGRTLKKQIYEQIVRKVDTTFKCDIDFTDDLDELSQDHRQGTLDGKIAYIYLDGNKFGHIRDSYCQSEADLQSLDKAVQVDLRAKALKAILNLAKSDPDYLLHGKKLRFETLLWGGDEIVWVVPAWKAWQVLAEFYTIKGSFSGHDCKGTEITLPLTHKCGVVFCHHNAPILQIREIARALADSAKNAISFDPSTHVPADKEAGDVIRYLVLESQDMIYDKLEQFECKYYKNIEAEKLIIRGSQIRGLCEAMEIVGKKFPHSKIYEIIRNIDKPSEINRLKERALSELDEAAVSEIDVKISEILDNSTDRWYLIAELWDYLK